MKSICFIANFYKTPTFMAIAEQLEKLGVSIFWIIPNRDQYDQLINSYDKEKCLLIDRSWINRSANPIGDFKLNELVYSDRVWQYSKNEGLMYLTNIQQPILDFIRNNDIKIVFGEVTRVHELLIHRMCNQLKELKCNFYSQMTTRIPNGKFFFFFDEKQYHIVPVENKQLNLLDEVKFEKPDYLAVNTKFLKDSMTFTGLLNRAKRFFSNENIDYTDSNVITNQRIRFKVVSQVVINQQRYRFLPRVDSQFVEDKKFVLFGFHKQPEASIDVCGRYFENQFENVVNLWRQLPPDWYLVIKEHSVAIGDRSHKFFSELLKYPRVVLMDEHADSQKLMQKAQLVCTNTGTMALEAALQGIPSITFSKVWFNVLNYCKHCNWQIFETYNTLADLINEIRSLPNNKEDYSNLINRFAFDGVLTDIVSMPNVLNVNNITKLVEAFVSLIEFNETNKTNITSE